MDVLAHAWYATRIGTPEGVTVCNADLTRVRDFLLHGPEGAAVAAGGEKLTAAQFEELRAHALDEMRARCGACGLCARFGREPP